MTLVYSFISTFFLNYFLCWILNLMGKGTFKVKFIVVTIVDLLMLGNECLNYIPYLLMVEENRGYIIFEFILSILGIIIGYFVILQVVNDGSKLFHFKSKRTRDFESAQKKEKEDLMLKGGMNNIVLAVGIVLLSALSIFFFFKNNYLYFGICCGVAVLCLVMLVISLIKKQKKYTLILLVEANERFYSFSKEIDKNQDYKECFKPLSDVYIIKPYGSVSYGHENHVVFGLKTDNVDEEYLNIDMGKNKYPFYKKIVKEFDGKKIYKLVIDESDSLISKEEIQNLRA